MASVTLPIDPSDPVLHELCGTNTAQAELSRQTFIRLWNDYNFKVKTFQESIIPSYQHPGLRAETVSGAARTHKYLEFSLTRTDNPATCKLYRRPQGACRDHLCLA